MDISNFYHIHDKKLGEGGFAKVRLATHLATRQYVAIKVLDKVRLGPELPRVYNEIECLKRLKHRHIAKLFQVFETPTVIYLVLEYCAGGELFDYIVSKSKLEEKESAQIIYDLMQVLDYIHNNGFAHRDLKPENVLFDERHQIKLIDFGLAANCSADNMAQNMRQQPLDQLSTCCGSITYAAPEIISGDQYSGTAVDVWSSGVLLYALLVGQLPFNDTNISKLYQKIQAGVKTYPSFLSSQACDLLKKMLTVDPKQRITVRQILLHPWLRNRSNTYARVNRRLDFCNGQIDELLFERCCEKFPSVPPTKLREYIYQDFNYYATTYSLMQAKCPPRTFGFRRTPDKINGLKRAPQEVTNAPSPLQPPPLPPLAPPHAPATQIPTPTGYASPTKKGRFMTVANAPKTPKTPPTYLQHLKVRQNGSTKQDKNVMNNNELASGPPNNGVGLQQENNNRMAAFIYGPTPKRSIVKRFLESATPSKLRQPRKISMHQNEIMNITLTRYRDPDLCLGHFEEALTRKGFQCKRKDFSLKCFNQSIRLTLEVCVYNNQCVIQRKRIKGDAWQYKLVCEEILRISNTYGAHPRQSIAKDTDKDSGLSPAKRAPAPPSEAKATEAKCTDV